ncbi:MAG: hypothetical protein MMC23_001045 [Stictis urceolatum]|nr:hypothetical protein [Stictis urceolata]
MGATWSQLFLPPPQLTEANLPPQTCKVFVVTGGYSGIGLELSTILHRAGGKVYIAASQNGGATGSLAFIPLVLDDLSIIKASADALKAQETRIDVLFNNAGVSLPLAGSVSAQGHELQLATNCLRPWLFTKLLLPLLQANSNVPASGHGATRVIWTSSQVADLQASQGDIDLAELDNPAPKN